ncbi:MAG TPA: IS4 family transposase [Anaeromyxobacteraceae bacterium]
MPLASSLAATAAFPRPEKLAEFAQHLPHAWIEQALQATGSATVRKRRLPAEQVVWLVLGMALFRDRSIVEVVDKLDLALPGTGEMPVAASAVPQARARLGDEPMAWLFAHSARHWAHASADGHRWRGLALYGLDGTSLRVPDTAENRAHFGGAEGRTESGYPMTRVVALMALRSHLLAATSFGPYTRGEHSYANELWSELPDDSLTIVDRNFLFPGVLVPLSRAGRERHWLIRAKKNTSWRVVKRLGPKDEIVEMEVSHQAREKDPSLPEVWRARAIHYQRKGFPHQTVLTSLLDPERYPAAELVVLYHERWELELGYDEIKTEVLEREETIRSKSPTAVAQELWGILLAYNLVRLEMERLADEAGVEPTRISFIASLHLVCDEWLWCAVASPGAIPKHLRNLRAKLARLVLPPRRARTYPRAVKVKMSSYPRKHPARRRKLVK